MTEGAINIRVLEPSEGHTGHLPRYSGGTCLARYMIWYFWIMRLT